MYTSNYICTHTHTRTSIFQISISLWKNVLRFVCLAFKKKPRHSETHLFAVKLHNTPSLLYWKYKYWTHVYVNAHTHGRFLKIPVWPTSSFQKNGHNKTMTAYLLYERTNNNVIKHTLRVRQTRENRVSRRARRQNVYDGSAQRIGYAFRGKGWERTTREKPRLPIKGYDDVSISVVPVTYVVFFFFCRS